MVNYGVVGDDCQWTVPLGEPAPALLVTGGCSEFSSEFSTSFPEVKWELTAALSAAGKSPSRG